MDPLLRPRGGETSDQNGKGYEDLALSPNAKLYPQLEASNPKSYALYPEPKVPTPAAPEELKNWDPVALAKTIDNFGNEDHGQRVHHLE